MIYQHLIKLHEAKDKDSYLNHLFVSVILYLDPWPSDMLFL